MGEQADQEITIAQQAFLAQLRADLSGTLKGLQVKGAEVRPVKTGQSTKVAGNSVGRLMGFSLRETTGAAAATAYIRDGVDNTGDIIVALQFLAAESVREYYANGLSYTLGLFLDVTSGSLEGSVWLNGTID